MSQDDEHNVIPVLFPNTGELRRDSVDRLLEERALERPLRRTGRLAGGPGARHDWHIAQALSEVIVRTPGATLVVWDIDSLEQVEALARALRASAQKPLLLIRVDPERDWAEEYARLVPDMMAEQGVTLLQRLFVKSKTRTEQGLLFSYRRLLALEPLELLHVSGPITGLEMMLRYALELTRTTDEDPMVLTHGELAPRLPLLARLLGVSSRTQLTDHGEVRALERAFHGIEGERR